MSTFDIRALANSLVNNGQFRLPPADINRMAEVVGYDPSFQDIETGDSYPAVSVTLGGDSAPMHGVRFSEGYVPNLGDTVMCATSGSDMYVVHAFAGAPKDTIGVVRSAMGIIGHASIKNPSDPTASATGAKIVTSVLPNRLYKVEVSAQFSSPVAGRGSQASISVKAPDGTILQIGKQTVMQNSSYTFHGAALWTDGNSEGWVNKYAQPTGSNPQGTWEVILGQNGFDNKKTWNDTTQYIPGDVVSLGTGANQTNYVCQKTIYVYSTTHQYQVGDVVVNGGAIFNNIKTATPVGTATSNTTYWTQVYASSSPDKDTQNRYWSAETAPTLNLGSHSVVIYDLGVAS